MDALDTLIQPHRVHRSLYTDPDIFVSEMERIFGGAWVYLAHESRLPDPNDFITTRMGLRPLILTRDGDGNLNALFNRCAHRASTVCQSECGSPPPGPRRAPPGAVHITRRLCEHGPS
ncbi:MAG: Rieske 2Fe-2S domain-containing protein, partial [Acidimicrobiaceae bacterium]|nr:Rieske 2Fe-2S domain-containing protein [Acidimicrobiaceae bacterium]